MSPSFGLLLVIISVVSSQFVRPGGNQASPPPRSNSLSCGFSCTRQASFSAPIDGQQINVRCTEQNQDPKVRCAGCCAAKALAANLETTNAAGFPSTNNVDCVCCINNPCNGI